MNIAARAADLPSSVERTDAVAPAAMALPFEILRDEAAFLALEPQWDALLARSATRTPFLTWDWVSLWWEQYRAEFRLAIGLVRDHHGTPLAIAPLVIGRPASGPQRHLRHITFIGGLGEITSEGMDFIIPRGLESSLAPALCQVFAQLRCEWDVARLPMLAEDSPNLPAIAAALGGTGTGAGIVERQPSNFISLPQSWEEVELSHGGNWRSNHRRKWKKMTGTHAGRPLRGGADLSAEASFAALLELHGRRWTAQESLFLRPRAIEFHRKLSARWMAQGRVDIGILDLDGRPAAATYCFVHDGRAWFYQAGWNADYTGISIGKMAVAWAVQCSIARGLGVFDFLPGDLAYKKEWSNGVRHLVDFEAFNPLSPRAALFRLLRLAKRWFLTAPAARGNPHSQDTSS